MTINKADCTVQYTDYAVKIWLPCGICFQADTEPDAWELISAAGYEVL